MLCLNNISKREALLCQALLAGTCPFYPCTQQDAKAICPPARPINQQVQARTGTPGRTAARARPLWGPARLRPTRAAALPALAASPMQHSASPAPPPASQCLRQTKCTTLVAIVSESHVDLNIQCNYLDLAFLRILLCLLHWHVPSPVVRKFSHCEQQSARRMGALVATCVRGKATQSRKDAENCAAHP